MSDRDSGFDTSDDDASSGFGPTPWHFNTNEDALSMLRESALRSELCTALGIESRFTADDDERRLESASDDEILVLGTEGSERRCEINEIESGPFLGTFGLFIAAARDGAMVEYIGLDEEIVYRIDHHTELFSASAALLHRMNAYEWIVAAPPAALHDDDPEIGPSKPFVVFDFDQTLASLNLWSECCTREFDAEAKATETLLELYTRCFGGTARIAWLRGVLTRLRDGGATLAILSNGNRAEIIDALTALGLLEFFSEDRIWAHDEQKWLHARCVVAAERPQAAAAVVGGAAASAPAFAPASDPAVDSSSTSPSKPLSLIFFALKVLQAAAMEQAPTSARKRFILVDDRQRNFPGICSEEECPCAAGDEWHLVLKEHAAAAHAAAGGGGGDAVCLIACPVVERAGITEKHAEWLLAQL